ncbi:MAG: amidohydrolase family protein [Oscillospiraceae bacterium]|nr:amidohydrolase family protein [Oscillospiraceae bacterium]
MYQLILKGGTVISPEDGINGVADVAVADGRIAALGAGIEGEARQVIDATGCIVTPGLIDHHCHLYPLASIGMPAEAQCFRSGVTTAVDAGSTGCDTFAQHASFLRQSKLRIRAYLNVCSTGLDSLPRQMEDVDPAHFDEGAIRAVFAEHGEALLGLKLRTSREVVRELGYLPLKKTVALAETLGVPVMVHCTNPPGTIPELLCYLRSGDVITHMYMNKGNTLLDGKGFVCREAYEARSRGVLFEAADAREHFSFAVSEPAIRAGFYPDIIATDLTAFSMNLRPTAFSMNNQIAKYTQLGIPFETVIACCTARPARDLGMEGEIGTLRVGACGDVAVFRREPSAAEFGDRPYGNPDGELRPCAWRLRTMLTVKNGEMVYRDELF